MTRGSAVWLAAIHYEAGFRIDEFLASISILLRARGIRLGGAIQLNELDAVNSCSAMTLVDLASGERIGISQDLGSLAQGCRLDTRGLAEFGGLLNATVGDDIELLILNKFGKAEAEGQGLRGIFVRAIEAGIPVLTAVRPPYSEAWASFHEGLAASLAPDPEVALAWCRRAVQARRNALQSVAVG